MSYRDMLHKLGAVTERKVLSLFDQYTAKKVTAPQFVATTATIIAKANGRAVVLADLSLAATLSLRMGVPVGALGLTSPEGDVERLMRAAETLLEVAEDTPDPRARVARLARVEPLDAAGRAYSEATAQHEPVSGYRRGLHPGACELCQWLAKTHLDPKGYVYPKGQPMHRHKGCTCIQIPVLKGQLI